MSMRGGNGAEENEYGVKDLTQILEELVIYCAVNGGSNSKITLKLPEPVLRAYSNSFIGSRVEDSPPVEIPNVRIGDTGPTLIKKLHVNGGTVEFELSVS